MSKQITGYARRTLPTLLIFVLLAAPATLIAPQPALAAPTFTVTSAADVVASAPLNNGVCQTASGNNVCTLRAAIMKANHFLGGGVTINIPSGTYTLTIPASGSDDETTGNLNITASMSIIGAGAASTIIDGNGSANNGQRDCCHHRGHRDNLQCHDSKWEINWRRRYFQPRHT